MVNTRVVNTQAVNTRADNIPAASRRPISAARPVPAGAISARPVSARTISARPISGTNRPAGRGRRSFAKDPRQETQRQQQQQQREGAAPRGGWNLARAGRKRFVPGDRQAQDPQVSNAGQDAVSRQRGRERSRLPVEARRSALGAGEQRRSRDGVASDCDARRNPSGKNGRRATVRSRFRQDSVGSGHAFRRDDGGRRGIKGTRERRRRDFFCVHRSSDIGRSSAAAYAVARRNHKRRGELRAAAVRRSAEAAAAYRSSRRQRDRIHQGSGRQFDR